MISQHFQHVLTIFPAFSQHPMGFSGEGSPVAERDRSHGAGGREAPRRREKKTK